MSTSTQSSTQAIIDRHNNYMSRNYPRYKVAMVRGEGSLLWDADGKEYLDLFSGFGAGVLGHCHPDLVAAVTEQANTLWHVGNLMHTEPQTLAAEAIAKHGFGGRSFFCHSGADANEAAFKLARLYGRANQTKGKPRYKVISTTQSFHGRSFASIMATGQSKVRDGFQPWLEGFSNVPYNDLEAMKNAIDDETAAIIVEPIQGEGGVNVPADGYLPGLRNLCDEHDLLLIVDEVWTGVGRTGKYFAHQHWGIKPDVMTLAKGVGGGLAVGVTCIGPKAADFYDAEKKGTVYHATTLGGNCLSMAVTARIFSVLERDGLVERAAALGKRTVQRLKQFADKHGVISNVRGKGLFIGIELNPEASGAWFKNAGEVVRKAMDAGLLLGSAQANVLRLAPPLVVTDEQLDRGLSQLEALLLKS